MKSVVDESVVINIVTCTIDIIYSRNRDGKLRLTGRYYVRCIHDVTNTTFRSRVRAYYAFSVRSERQQW